MIKAGIIKSLGIKTRRGISEHWNLTLVFCVLCVLCASSTSPWRLGSSGNWNFKSQKKTNEFSSMGGTDPWMMPWIRCVLSMVGVCKHQRENGRYRFQKVIVCFAVGLATDDASGSQAHLTINRHIYLLSATIISCPWRRGRLYASQISKYLVRTQLSTFLTAMPLWTTTCVDTEHTSLMETFHYLELWTLGSHWQVAIRGYIWKRYSVFRNHLERVIYMIRLWKLQLTDAKSFSIYKFTPRLLLPWSISSFQQHYSSVHRYHSAQHHT